MQVLFVHGMGRSPLSGWPLLRLLRRAGLSTTTFAYFTSTASLDTISVRLVQRIVDLSEREPVVLVGHSLGGLLLRHALERLPANCKQPLHLFLLGSPLSASLLAKKLSKRWIFRAVAGDCGQFLACSERMASIGQARIAVTSIVGTRGLPSVAGRLSPLRNEPNDCVVTVAEASAPWLEDRVEIPVVHTLLPSSSHAAAVILQRLRPYRLEIGDE